MDKEAEKEADYWMTYFAIGNYFIQVPTIYI